MGKACTVGLCEARIIEQCIGFLYDAEHTVILEGFTRFEL
jgi:hypothetical protein